MTMGVMKDRVRELIGDTVSQYRWSDDYIYASIVDAIHRLSSVRPESRYVDGYVAEFVFPVMSLMENFEIPVQDRRWDRGITYYAGARCLERDNSDTANIELSSLYYQKAEGIFQQ